MTMLGVSWINSQIVFDGIVQGLAIAVIAVGVILVYRATRIINFAVGGMGVVGAVMLALLTIQYHVPFWPSPSLGAPHRARVRSGRRRDDRASPAKGSEESSSSWRRLELRQVAQAIAVEIPAPSNTWCSLPVGVQWFVDGGGSEHPRLRPGGPGLGPDRRSPSDLVPRPNNARQDRAGMRQQSGPGPSLGHQPEVGVDDGLVDRRGPLDTLDRADRRSVGLGGDGRQPRTRDALPGAGRGRHRRNDVLPTCSRCRQSSSASCRTSSRSTFSLIPGLADLVLFLVILVALGFYGRELGGDAQVFAFTPKARPIPERLRSVWWIRHIDKSGMLLLGLIGILLPLIVTRPSSQQLFAAVAGLRHLCVVADRRDGVAWSAVTGPDGIRRDRSALRRSTGLRRRSLLGDRRS